MSDLQQRINELRERGQQGNPPLWNFDEDGLEVIGIVMGGGMASTKFGPAKVITIQIPELQNELRSVFVLGTAFNTQVDKAGLQVGDLVYIARSAEKRSNAAGTQEYWEFTVVKEGQPGAALWGGSQPQALPPGVVEAEVVDDGWGQEAGSQERPSIEQERMAIQNARGGSRPPRDITQQGGTDYGEF